MLPHQNILCTSSVKTLQHWKYQFTIHATCSPT